jgi:neutral ceramidase
MSTAIRIACAAAALVAAACGTSIVSTPANPSAAPNPTGTLTAGFARVDITPPPGAGLLGWGSEGVASHGHRGRLYARAMVLQDARGERLAFAVVDLAMVSQLLQRRVAARLDSMRTGIGPDRLLLSATHTHGGPANFMGVHAYDEYGSDVVGYDPVLADSLVARIARAVRMADSTKTTARAAWGIDSVWGLTRIRDFDAFLRNGPPPADPSIPAGLEPEQRGVDPRWAMLRVDVWGDGGWRPRGAFSVFAVHGTAVPEESDLYDADLHGIASRVVERHVDSLNNVHPLLPEAVHLMANSAEGDVSPAYDRRARCDVPRLTRERRGTGPRSPPASEDWALPRDRERATCLLARKAWALKLGTEMGRRASALFDRIGREMDAHPAGAPGGPAALEIARAFGEFRFGRGERGVCARPGLGIGTPAGAEDGYTRFLQWRDFIFGRPFGTPTDPYTSRRDCQAPKDRGLTWLIATEVGPHGAPLRAQFTVARVGGVALAAIPWEATTTTGRWILAGMQPALDSIGVAPGHSFVLGLTNGYVYYAATAREYGLQMYEGSGTIYGPGTADFLRFEMSSLASRLPRPGGASPSAVVWTDTAYPWKKARLLDGHDSIRFDSVVAYRDTVEGDSALVVRWRGEPHGRFSSDAPRLLVLRRQAAGWDTVAWDGDPEMEVRATRGNEDWEARWTPCVRQAGAYRVVLAPLGRLREHAGTVRDLKERTCHRPPPWPDPN